MIKSTRDGRRITAHQLAKEAIADRLQLVEYFMEGYPDEWGAMTEKEQEDFWLACEKKIKALRKYLGVDYLGQPLEGARSGSTQASTGNMVKEAIADLYP